MYIVFLSCALLQFDLFRLPQERGSKTSIPRMLVRQAEGTSAFKRQCYSSVGISIAQAQSVYSNNISCIQPLSRVL